MDRVYQSLQQMHEKLNEFNKRRLTPSVPNSNWRAGLLADAECLLIEGQMLEEELTFIRERAKKAPTDAVAFMAWFEDLRQSGPGQHDHLFDWLENEASVEQMRWFIRQEVAGEAGFEDLTALTQVKMPTRSKLEMARNYWDEMGRGIEKGMHGPMLARVAKEIGLEEPSARSVVHEALALANILTGLAANRRYAYHSVGALGVIELTAPDRARKVQLGLKRVGLSAEGQRYYLLHASVDIKHSLEWNKEVICPFITESPELAVFIAEGALVRLNAGARCFERYRKEFGLENNAIRMSRHSVEQNNSSNNSVA